MKIQFYLTILKVTHTGEHTLDYDTSKERLLSRDYPNELEVVSRALPFAYEKLPYMGE